MLHVDFDYAKEPGWMTALSTFELADREHGAFSASSASRPDLGHILASARWYDTTDVRDRVYGLFGLLQKVTEQSPEGVRTLLVPDYTKSWVEIFRDAMRAALETKGDLTLLEEAQHRVGELDDATKELPSWVPHWGRRWEPLADPFPLGALFRADGGKVDPGQGACPWDPDVLTATGKQISTVASACAVSFADDSSVMQLALTINECRSELERAGLKYFDQALAHTLIAGTDSNREPSGPVELQAYSSFVQYDTDADSDRTDSSAASSDLLIAYEQAARKACSNRRLFTTGDGRIGLGPPDMRRYDVVAILLGAEWPVVLRRLGQHRWCFVGQCYTHGIMYGEAVRDDSFESFAIF